MPSEIARHADFSGIRYGQCWEDADVLLDALDIRPGDTCVSVASAGDNTLAMLARDPGRVIAVDLSAAQLACLELRIAAFRGLSHGELLELIGSTPSPRRGELYRRCRGSLSPEARRFWDARPRTVDGGIGGAGRFERYFALFRRRVLPLIHTRPRIERLLRGAGGADERYDFYDRSWDTWRWRLLFRIFFSRAVMGRLGRDPSFFRYVEGAVADRILQRTRHALTELDPAENPYLQWILTGRHHTALPFALRPEHFELIRDRVDRIEWRRASIEDLVAEQDEGSIDRFNLSDVFEYMPEPAYERLLTQIARTARPGARLAYWNMLAPRSRPAAMADRIRSLDALARDLHARDKAFFYSALVVEEAA